MIQITRNQARQIRALFKRLLSGRGRRIDPTIQFEAGPQGLEIRSWTLQGAVQYHAGGTFPPTSSAVPLSALQACEGKSDAPVEFDDSGFPPTPKTFTSLPAGLLMALHQASQCAADENTRYALDHIQLDGAKGRIAATDGHHALLQSGFQFPWQDAVLIPASGVFASPEFAHDDPVGIGRTDKWLSFSIGPWQIHLPIDKDGRYPRCDDIAPKPEKIVSRLQIAEHDAKFLRDAIPGLPGDEDNVHHPVTLQLDGEVIVRATASDQPQPTELVLTNSQLVGEPVKIGLNREFLSRALKLGFRELGLINSDAILTFQDEKRKYLIMPLTLDKNAKPATGAMRIESGAADPNAQPQRLRVAPSTSNPETTMTKPKDQAETAVASNGTSAAEQESAIGPIGAAIQLRGSLRTALADVTTLITSLRRQKRQQNLVQSTLQSLKDLQKIAG